MVTDDMTPRKAKKLTYGAWGGNPEGEPYRPERCVVRVSGPGRGFVSYQCTRKNGHGPHGLYCKQHDPAAVKAREEPNERKYHERLAAKSAPSAELVALRRLRDAVLAAQTVDGGVPNFIRLDAGAWFRMRELARVAKEAE